MNRYIGTDQLAEELKKSVVVSNADELWEGWHACTIAVDEAIRRTPTADVRENVKGEWKTTYLDHVAIGERPKILYCSICNQCIAYPTNYCPNCGANMKGEL